MNTVSLFMTPSTWLKKIPGWEKAPAIQRQILVLMVILLALFSFASAMNHWSNWKLTHNDTHSISQKLILLHTRHLPNRNQLVIFLNPRHPHPEHPAGTWWIKVLRGLPGDIIEIVDRKVFVNGQFIAMADTRKPDGTLYDPLPGGVIPPHKYLAMGTAPDSFDSRYEIFGLVDESNIIGTGYAIY